MTDLQETGASHLLQINEIPVGSRGGMIGLTHCPGKKLRVGYSRRCVRNTAQDIAALSSWSADVALILVELKEIIELDVIDLTEELDTAGITWHHLPIVDRCAPCHNFEHMWHSISDSLKQLLIDGRRLVIHSKCGLGRAGTVAAKLLIELGASPQDAINTVKRSTGENVIQTKAQLEYLCCL